AYSGDTNGPTYAHGGSYYAIIGGTGVTGDSYGFQQFTIPSGVPNANLTMWVRITNSGYPTTSTSDTLEADVYDASLHFVATLGSVSGKDATGSSVGAASWAKIGPFDLSAYKGQTINLVLYSTCNAGTTTFRVDDLSLVTQYANTDENGDGKVDGLDLGAFAQGYGTDPLSDFNNDDATDDADATILLSAFGQ
ncbi:MAG TPA: hypothetical protein VFM16_03970, partial [Holophagaceae bacterium]|nr:hypothetical protein [Holophagaceae bacterium]